jgi:hypothetical protein
VLSRRRHARGQRGVLIDRASEFRIAATDLLRQLVLNVARVPHSPPGGSVAIDVERDAATVKMRVTDSGAGVRRRTAADFRSVRPVGSVAPGSGDGLGPSDRPVDCGSAPRHAGTGAERRHWQHVLRFTAGVTPRSMNQSSAAL